MEPGPDAAVAGTATAGPPADSALRVDPDDVAGPRLRIQLDWRTFVYLTVAVLAALALAAVLDGTTTMITRVGIGILVALALDPVTDSVQRRSHLKRGWAVAIVGAVVLLLAALLVGVLGPRAVEQARQFSDQLPATVDELEKLPVVGGYLRDNEVADRVQEWVRKLPERFTDERVASTARTLVSSIAGIAIVAVIAITVLIDGENLIGRIRRLIPQRHRAAADEAGRVVYRTLGRYIGGSVTVAVLMGLFVLTLGLVLSIPLIPLAAIWAMLTDLIPQVGGFLGGSFLVLLAATESTSTALIAGAAFVLYMNIENHVIQPAIVGKSVDLTPPTTMVAAFVGAAVAGVPGALVATPITGAVKAIYLEARGKRKPADEDGDRRPGLVRRLRSHLARSS